MSRFEGNDKVHPSPLALSPPSLEDRERARKRGFEIQRQMNKKKDMERLRQKKLREEQWRVAAEARKRNKGCWRSHSGNMICPRNKQRGIFVTPKQFERNVTKFILEDLPMASTGVFIAGLAAPGLIPAGIATAATLGSRAITGGKIAGRIVNKLDPPKASQKKLEDINVGDKCWKAANGKIYCENK